MGLYAFPRYASHADVKCFNCDKAIGGPTPSDDHGYPFGSGRFSAGCSGCQMRTWYDVTPKGAK
jgi:hypothetical protein